jgi:hypothetical protein
MERETEIDMILASLVTTGGKETFQFPVIGVLDFSCVIEVTPVTVSLVEKANSSSADSSVDAVICEDAELSASPYLLVGIS